MNDLSSDTRDHTRDHSKSENRQEVRGQRAGMQRPRDERLVLGVCGAIANRFEVDVLIVRVLIVMAGALFDYVSLAYVLGVLIIPAAPRAVDQWGKVVRGRKTRRPRRQLFAYIVLAIVANAVLHNSIPTSRSFAVALIVGGVLMMQLRSRATLEKRRAFAIAAPESTDQAGGWTGASPLPPRWGLAGETMNPHVWAPTSVAAPAPGESKVGEKRPTMWQTQFGNLALVVLVSVLAVGLWSNTSRSSPVRRAALIERLADGGVVVRNAQDIEELNAGSLGDGSFVIDASQLNGANEKLNISMGSGKLELVLPSAFVSSGEINTTGIGHLGAELNGKTLSAPFVVTDVPRSVAASKRDRLPTNAAPRFRFSISAQNGFVCVRTAAETCAINSTNSPLQSPSPKK